MADLTVGMLCAGFFGEQHARAIAAVPGLRLAAVSDCDEALARRLADRYGGAAGSDWRQLVADTAIDIVVIATPHELHMAMAIAAAQAGKHILLEKPMGRTPTECTAILEAAERSRTTLLIGQLLHFALPSLVARQILDAGDLGRPIAGASSLVKLWMEPNRRPWHLDPARGGGMLMTAGIPPSIFSSGSWARRWQRCLPPPARSCTTRPPMTAPCCWCASPMAASAR